MGDFNNLFDGIYNWEGLTIKVSFDPDINQQV
jgi:hypothetical protein